MPIDKIIRYGMPAPYVWKQKNTMHIWIALCLLGLLFVGCGHAGNTPQSYDPPGSTITTTKEITPQKKRTIGVSQGGVWVSNEFAGARLNDFFQDDDGVYTAVIKPENAPVNNSAWYAFKIWGTQAQTVKVRLTYEDGDHRYVPKLSPDGKTWTPIDRDSYVHDTTNGTATLRLDIGPDTLWVAGQEVLTSAYFARWMDDLTRHPQVSQRVIGESRQGRPLRMLQIGDAPEVSRYVLVISRQHPPEVPGTLAALTFLETLAADSDLAKAFRQQFKVLAVPLVNPDGVDNGHWRHNAGGVDLNRDWLNFNQPEARAVREAFLAIKKQPDAQVYFGIDFHSTQEDVFYTLARDLKTKPPGFIDAWLDKIRASFPDYYVNDEPYGLGSPVSKNWFYETFDIPATTYEVGDESDRALIQDISSGAAKAMMELLLKEVE